MKNDDSKWQKALLPFMQITIVLLTAFYLIASYTQFSFFVKRVEKPATTDFKQFIAGSQSHSLNDSVSLEEKRWLAQCFFESYVVEARQRNAEFLMISRTWIKYLGFVTGVILSVVGAVFILGKLKDENQSAVEGGSTSVKFALQSHSPGIIMAVLGAALIISTIFTHQNIEKTDAAVYLNSASPYSNNQPAEINQVINAKDSVGTQKPDTTVKRPPGF